MAAFDRVLSGFPSVDGILDSIRLGDNVVWQVSDMEEYALFAQAFAKAAVEEGRKLIYVRFAQHPPVIAGMDGVEVLETNPDVGFESFTVGLREKITEYGKEACYVFDCLSELQSVWYTDLMMGNFFCVTCPYLFELDTVAYFPLLRGRHSFDTVARIRETTQLLLNVYSGSDRIYLHPLKVWNRNGRQMFLPHGALKDSLEFSPVENGVAISRFYQTVQSANEKNPNQRMDSHDRFFAMAKAAWELGVFTDRMEKQIIDSTMTKDPVLKELVRQYFTPADYFTLRERMIGSGAIGGKACGMLLARKIAQVELPDQQEHWEPHDSYYIGSDVFYTYLVSNGAWELRLRQRTREGYFAAAQALREQILQGRFPGKIRDRLVSVLEHFGQSPFIVRSSSFLEDGFGNAFAGKYESVFCPNQGSPQERMEDFENAIRQVYASTMDYSALEYRARRGLAHKDEQMAVLVQRVSGSYYGNYFMPGAAGVGYSHSAYKWLPDMDADAGMLRLVIGLGTKAVDRTREDYPRLVNLDRPTVSLANTPAKRHRFSQRHLDVIDCDAKAFREVPLSQILPSLPQWYRNLVLEHDTEAERSLRELGRKREVLFVSCQHLLENRAFTDLMQALLKTLQRVYGNAVDIEYTVNMNSQGEFVVNLLQCRPLYLGRGGKAVDLSRLSMEQVFFEVTDSAMSPSCLRKLDTVVYIDPAAYYRYPYQSKGEVAQLVGKVNRWLHDQGRQAILVTPGRIGTSSPELGVPVNFGEISNFSVICEVSDPRTGYAPELSYGSHMFQDLVEAEIAYVAILSSHKTKTYAPEALGNCEDLLSQILPEAEAFRGMVKVLHTPNLKFAHDALAGIAKCGI